MDPAVLALMIPIVAIVCGTLLKYASMRTAASRDAGGGDTLARLDALEQETAALRHELAEAHERLDFTERLLAQGPPSKRLGEE